MIEFFLKGLDIYPTNKTSLRNEIATVNVKYD